MSFNNRILSIPGALESIPPFVIFGMLNINIVDASFFV